MRFDISLKSALNGLEMVFGKAFLGLDIRDAEPLNIEFPKIEEKEADYIFKAKLSNDQSIIVHIEFQTSNHKDMHFRMLRYLGVGCGRGKIFGWTDNDFCPENWQLDSICNFCRTIKFLTSKITKPTTFWA